MSTITSATFARRVFGVAGIYGVLVLVPLYFLEARLNQAFPPPLTHPEHFYGLIGVALAWQAVFMLIANDVPRYRHLAFAAAYRATRTAAVVSTASWPRLTH